jgi:hypothetical protein
MSDCMLTGALTAPDKPHLKYDSDDDPYCQDLDALEVGEFVW